MMSKSPNEGVFILPKYDKKTKEYKDVKYHLDMNDLKKAFGKLTVRKRLRKLNRYFNFEGQLCVKSHDGDSNEFLRAFGAEEINEVTTLLENDFGGILGYLDQVELNKFIRLLKPIFPKNFKLFSRNMIDLTGGKKDNPLVVLSNHNVKEHGLTESSIIKWLHYQGFDYEFLLHLLNIATSFSFHKESIYLYGAKDSFKSSFIGTVIKELVGSWQFLAWKEQKNNNHDTEDFRRNLCCVLLDDWKNLDPAYFKEFINHQIKVNPKGVSGFYMDNYALFILTNNNYYKSFKEQLDNRHIPIYVKNPIKDVNPELYDELSEVWFGEDRTVFTRELEDVLSDLWQFKSAFNPSLEDSLSYLRGISEVHISRSLWDIASYVIHDVDEIEEVVNEYAEVGIELNLESDFVSYEANGRYDKLKEIINELCSKSPLEVIDNLKNNSNRGITELRNNGVNIGYQSNKNNRWYYTNTHLLTNIDAILKKWDYEDQKEQLE